MNYELAKELKDAGFPQTNDDGSLKGTYLFPEGVSLADKKMHEKAVYAPTLSELIEACGVGFNSLERQENGLWSATGFEGPARHTLVSIPVAEEAVARLWLALKK